MDEIITKRIELTDREKDLVHALIVYEHEEASPGFTKDNANWENPLDTILDILLDDFLTRRECNKSGHGVSYAFDSDNWNSIIASFDEKEKQEEEEMAFENKTLEEIVEEIGVAPSDRPGMR